MLSPTLSQEKILINIMMTSGHLSEFNSLPWKCITKSLQKECWLAKSLVKAKKLSTFLQKATSISTFFLCAKDGAAIC
jgi:hypothetical protein